MTRTSKTAAGVDELDNTDRRRLLGIINQFRELGVNEDISLPQVRIPEENLYLLMADYIISSWWLETNPIESLLFSRVSQASASRSQVTCTLASPRKSFYVAARLTKRP